MAIVTKFSVSGMNSEKYEEALSRLQAAGAGAPPGRLYHVSYGSPDDLQVIDVYDSPQSFETFGQTLVPILTELGIQAQPEISDVYRIIEG
jgi:hypothetical protein